MVKPVLTFNLSAVRGAMLMKQISSLHLWVAMMSALRWAMLMTHLGELHLWVSVMSALRWGMLIKNIGFAHLFIPLWHGRIPWHVETQEELGQVIVCLCDKTIRMQLQVFFCNDISADKTTIITPLFLPMLCELLMRVVQLMSGFLSIFSAS